MQLHEIKPKHKPKPKKRLGRGGKRGTYSGRGIKGQKARAGAKIRPEIRDFIKKIPKKRGYRFKAIKSKPEVVNLRELERYFQEGEIVSPETLLEKGLVGRIKGRIPEVKILGTGELKKKFKIENCKMSKGAEKVLGIKKPAASAKREQTGKETKI